MTSDLWPELNPAAVWLFLLTFQFYTWKWSRFKLTCYSSLSFLALCFRSSDLLRTCLTHSPDCVYLLLSLEQSLVSLFSLYPVTLDYWSVSGLFSEFAVNLYRKYFFGTAQYILSGCVTVSDSAACRALCSRFSESAGWSVSVFQELTDEEGGGRRGVWRRTVQSETTFPSFSLISSLLSHNIKLKYLY